MPEQFANHPGTVLSAAITSTTRPVTFSVASVANLPTQGNFRVLIDSEIFLITTISGTSLTGANVEGTAAATHASGANVLHLLTAGALVQAEADTITSLLTNAGTFTGAMTFASLATFVAAALTVLLKSAGQAALDLWNSNTGGTPATGARWRLFADNVGGGGGNLTFGLYDVTNSRLAWGIDNNGYVTFPNAALISFGSNYQSFTPSLSASGSMTVTVTQTYEAKYIRIGPKVEFTLELLLNLGGTSSNQIFCSLPVAAAGFPTAAARPITGYIFISTGNWNAAVAYIAQGTGLITLQLSGAAANIPLGSTYVMFSGSYEVA